MSNLKVNTINDANGGSAAVLYGVASPPNSMGFRNRIINGDMRIDQRNNGASVTPVPLEYQIDRWRYLASQSSKITMGRNQGGVTPPSGFTNYLGLTSSSSYSVLAADFFAYQQFIEGLNASDLAWGTAGAQAVTLSFWVRSSLTGTFGGSVQNSGSSRSYPFTYSISSANTWEQKTIAIPGDTSGTWLTDTGRGIGLQFGLGVGSNNSGAAGAWAAADYRSATGAVSVVGTSGATFYITGVQLEAGTVATPFERRDYGRELMMCQRYAIKYLGTGSFEKLPLSGWSSNTTTFTGAFCLPVAMRSSPSLTFSNIGSASAGGSNAVSAINVDQASLLSPSFAFVTTGLTVGNAAVIQANNNTSAFVILSSEL